MPNSLVKRHWFEILLVGAVMAVHLYAATSDAHNFPANWFTRDDAYYYFKVAQNLTEGRGLTFDGINPTNGYHPLWMLVNIPIFALARFDLILPLRILLLLQGALSAGTALLLYRIIRGTISHPLAVLAACWWAFDSYIHGTMYEYGLETGLASFAAALLIYQLCRFERTLRGSPPSRLQVARLAVFAVVALFSRLDLVFLSILAGAFIILRGTSLRVLLPLDLLLALVSILASFTYRLGVRDYYLYTQAAIAMIAISIVTKAILYYFLGLYHGIYARRFGPHVARIAIAVTASSLLTGGIMLAGSSFLGTFPRLALAYDWLLNLAGMIILRALARVFNQRTEEGDVSPVGMLKTRWRTWAEEALAYYSVLGIPLGLYLLFNKFTFGIAMPISGQVKRWWGSESMRAYGGPARNPLAFWGVDPEGDYNALRPFTSWLSALSEKIANWLRMYRSDEAYVELLLAACLLVLAVMLVNRRRSVRVSMQTSLPLLFTASALQVMSYNITGYSAIKEWYWITEPMLLVVAFCLLTSALSRSLEQLVPGRIFMWLLVAAIVLPMAWNFASLSAARMPHGVSSSGLPYLDSVQFLEQHTPPGAMIGMTGGGNVGYYIRDRVIVNMDGLINSLAYFEALKAGQATSYLRAIGLDYIFANPTILEGKPYRGQYATGSKIGRFGGKALTEFGP